MLIKKKFIGEDEFGNKYYQKGERRLVEYSKKKDKVGDPSTISARWHLWLHNAVEAVEKPEPSNWQMQRVCNQTGTTLAYDPKIARGGVSSEDYSAWQPGEQQNEI